MTYRTDRAGAVLAELFARGELDNYTTDHSERVVELSAQVAERLRLSADDVADVQHVALLHDIGKVAVPDHVLAKPGPLDADEFALIRMHTVVGAQIVEAIPALAHLAPAVRAGHERWDGLGYPDGLAGDDIPLLARITFVCDAYDAMTSDRPYRDSLGAPRARRELARGAGTQFCRRSVAALLAVIDSP